MTKDDFSLEQSIAKSTLVILPEYTEISKEFGRESVQSTIWLVGLSVTAIGFLSSNFFQNSIEALQILIRISLFLFASVILFGIAHRISYFRAEEKYISLMLEFKMFLIGYIEGQQIESPSISIEESPPNGWMAVAEHIVKEKIRHSSTIKTIYAFLNLSDEILVKDIPIEERNKQTRERSKKIHSDLNKALKLHNITCVLFIIAIVFTTLTIIIAS